ncbi:MAG TPA: hypothetical protein VFT00_03550 [Nocardioides sp.]|nr:hypothetical protein [Nocardioides sp.]
MTEWVSGRGAAEILGAAGISRTMSCRILAAGLAGEPLRTSSATLYDASRVRGLLERRSVDVDHLPPPSDRALLEIRVPPGSTSESWTRIGNAGAIVRVQLRVLAQRHGFLPTVVTCCGFVLGGLEVTGALPLNQASTSKLETQPPGEWFTAFTGRRLHSTAGNPWRLWLQPAAA